MSGASVRAVDTSPGPPWRVTSGEPDPRTVERLLRSLPEWFTDIHAAHGDWPVRPSPPFIPGHEGIGRIEKVGPGVTTRRLPRMRVTAVELPERPSAARRCEELERAFDTASGLSSAMKM